MLGADNFRGLQKRVYLAVEGKVTIATNMQPAYGRLNGTGGTVKDIAYLPGSTPNFDLPSFIIVHVPKYIGPQFFIDDDNLHNYIPLSPLEIATDVSTGLSTYSVLIMLTPFSDRKVKQWLKL